MSVRKSSHGTIFLIVSSGSTLIASSLRSTSKKPFCPMTRSVHRPMTACGHRVRFVATWREEFFEVPFKLFKFPYLDRNGLRAFSPRSYDEIEKSLDVIVLTDCFLEFYDQMLKKVGAETRADE